jgi:multidrug efflux pump subunit AcrA (membrane-fusion protein)
VRIEGYVPVEQVWQLKVGQPVRVQLDLGGDQKLPMEQEIFTGTLGFVDVTVQSVAGTVRIWAEIENRKELLKDGLSARMSIEPVGKEG